MVVQCKETYTEKNGVIIYRKNIFYDVFIEYDDCYWVFTHRNYDVHKFFKKSDNKYNFHLYFDDYFYTIRENRKKKLLQLFDK